MAKDIKDYSVAELQALIEQKKQGEVDNIKEKLKAARGIVAELEAQLEKLTGKAAAKTSGKAKKGAVEAAILNYLANNKEASPKDIISATGLNSGSINQKLAVLKKAGKIKQGKGRGAPYSLK